MGDAFCSDDWTEEEDSTDESAADPLLPNV
jgi:hypothetical protein